MNCSYMIPEIPCLPDLNQMLLDSIQELKPGDRKLMRLLAKQYIITEVEQNEAVTSETTHFIASMSLRFKDEILIRKPLTIIRYISLDNPHIEFQWEVDI